MAGHPSPVTREATQAPWQSTAPGMDGFAGACNDGRGNPGVIARRRSRRGNPWRRAWMDSPAARNDGGRPGPARGHRLVPLMALSARTGRAAPAHGQRPPCGGRALHARRAGAGRALSAALPQAFPALRSRSGRRAGRGGAPLIRPGATWPTTPPPSPARRRRNPAAPGWTTAPAPAKGTSPATRNQSREVVKTTCRSVSATTMSIRRSVP